MTRSKPYKKKIMLEDVKNIKEYAVLSCICNVPYLVDIWYIVRQTKISYYAVQKALKNLSDYEYIKSKKGTEEKAIRKPYYYLSLVIVDNTLPLNYDKIENIEEHIFKVKMNIRKHNNKRSIPNYKARFKKELKITFCETCGEFFENKFLHKITRSMQEHEKECKNAIFGEIRLLDKEQELRRNKWNNAYHPQSEMNYKEQSLFVCFFALLFSLLFTEICGYNTR